MYRGVKIGQSCIKKKVFRIGIDKVSVVLIKGEILLIAKSANRGDENFGQMENCPFFKNIKNRAADQKG